MVNLKIFFIASSKVNLTQNYQLVRRGLKREAIKLDWRQNTTIYHTSERIVIRKT